ncbi:MAG: PilZ domain-containing protein [Bdellovibrionales bacterium]|jgi:hypothetical protein|nr:PilZ domain-containing protein [Bdellovibrionales bacterium]
MVSSDDGELVTDPAEIEQILQLAMDKRVEFYCDFDGHELPFLLRAVKGSNAVLGLWTAEGAPPPLLAPVLGNKLTAGLKVEAVFTLPSGQYALRQEILNPTLTTMTLSAERGLVRLQRRRDFRAYVRSYGIHMICPQLGPNARLDVIDLSVGGMRVVWPKTFGEPVTGVNPNILQIKGTLHLLDGKTVSVSARYVRSLGKQGAAHDAPFGVTYQFVDPSQEVAQAILFTCMACMRKSYSDI